MTLIQLESFLRTAETLSFTKAAQRLYVSRQVASAHVKALEKELGRALFRREGKAIQLTEGGAILFRRLSAMEGQFRAALAYEGAALTFDLFLRNRGDRLKLFPIRQMTGVPMIQLAAAYRRNGSPLLEELAMFFLESGL